MQEHLSLKKYVIDIVVESTAPPEPLKDGEERQKNKKKAKKIKARMNFRYHEKKKVKLLVCWSCLTPCDPVDCSSPDSSVHGILQARILELVATSPLEDLPNLGIKPGCPAWQVDSLLARPPGKPPGAINMLKNKEKVLVV